MPDHSSPPLFLPIAHATAADFFERGIVPGLPIERAALFVCMLQIANPAEHAAVERMLSSSEGAFAGDDAKGREQLLRLRAQGEDFSIKNIVQALASTALTFAPQEKMFSRAWAGPDDRYTYAFQSLCRGTLDELEVHFHPASNGRDDDEGEAPDPDRPPRSRPIVVRVNGTREQTVVANVIASARDEHIAVNAYAGTGKTHLIHTLASSLGNAITYIAPSQAHLYGFHAHAASNGHNVRVTTLWQLAHDLCRAHARALGMNHAPRQVRSLSNSGQQAEVAGIEAIAGTGKEWVLQNVLRAINRWCHSADEEIADRHFQHAREITPEQRLLYRQAAARVWKAMFDRPPRSGPSFDININHLAKWLVQSKAQIPALFGLLMVDEAHDLQPAWAHLFFRYAGGCVLLGDPHQRLQGSMLRAAHAKPVTMAQSVRMGLGADTLVQRTLAMAPRAAIDEPFAGSRQHITRQRLYSSISELPDDGLRIHGSEWALLADALRLRDAGARFRILPASTRELQRLIPAAVSLFRHGDAYRGALVNGQRSWSGVVDSLEKQGRQDVVRLFERGFNDQHLRELLAAETAEGDDAVTLALIDHAKNLESPRVLLMDSCFDLNLGQRRYNPANATYLALTRARNEVWLPGDALERLGELQRLQP